ncbi:MAG: hypothetical protein E7666_06895 [Ruminococcaceae bacterium]|nr:hypothetical protein [Oscillospiraceae bacterium]
MKTMNRMICLLLMLVICLGAFAGCNTPENPPEDTSDTDESKEESSSSDDGSDDTVTTMDERERDDLKQTYDFGGAQEFVILSRATTSYEFDSSKGFDGTAVEIAIYERNEEVMERCNLEFRLEPIPGTWEDRDAFTTTIRTNAALPVSDYDLIATHQAYLVSLTLEGAGWDFTELSDINVNKKWWSKTYYDECNYNGAIYMMYGDIAYTLYEYLEVIFFNEQTAEDLELGDLYDLALEGDWTFAKLQEYTKKVTTNMDAAETDREYGLISNAHSHRALCSSMNVQLAPVGTDGMHAFSILLKPDQEEILQGVADFIVETPNVYYDKGVYTAEEVLDPIFAEGRALFYTQKLGQSGVLKGLMKEDYGVLPFPKYNENQKEYRSEICDEVTAILAPYNCKNPDMTGTVTEMLSMISYQEVIDEYYGEKLKYQSFNNPKCVKTLDLIRDAFAPNFVTVYSYPLEFPNSLVSGIISNSPAGQADSVSGGYLSKSGTWRLLLKDIYEKLDTIAAGRTVG